MCIYIYIYVYVGPLLKLIGTRRLAGSLGLCKLISLIWDLGAAWGEYVLLALRRLHERRSPYDLLRLVRKVQLLRSTLRGGRTSWTLWYLLHARVLSKCGPDLAADPRGGTKS